jgi:hypothetical protein
VFRSPLQGSVTHLAVVNSPMNLALPDWKSLTAYEFIDTPQHIQRQASCPWHRPVFSRLPPSPCRVACSSTSCMNCEAATLLASCRRVVSRNLESGASALTHCQTLSEAVHRLEIRIERHAE